GGLARRVPDPYNSGVDIYVELPLARLLVMVRYSSLLVLLLGIAPGLSAQTAHSGAAPRARLEGKWQARSEDEIRNIMVRIDSSAQFGDQVASRRSVGDSRSLTLGYGVWQVYGMKLE